jgi:hypothetical protein
MLLSPNIGPLAGAQREGLHSVLKHICEKNQLTVNDVFSNLILPQCGTPPNRVTKMGSHVHLINRGCAITKRLISRIHELVFVPDLSVFTLREFVELRGIGEIAIAHDRKWCPECFDSDLATKVGPYDRLLWCIDDVQICPSHKVRLRNICPSCGGGPFRVLVGHDISGHCPKCLSWLGGRSVILEENRDEHTQFLFWLARTYANLLETPLPSQLDVSQGINEVLRALAEKHFEGNYAALARAVDRNKSVLCTWLKGKGSPSWRALTEISYVFQLPLPELLLGQYDGVSISTIRKLPLASITRLTHPRKLPQRRNTEDIKSFLAGVEIGKISNLTTLNSVAKRLNINPRELRRIAPIESAELSKVLADRRKLSRSRKQEDRERLFRDEIPKAVSKLLNNGLQPTRRALHKLLTEVGISVMRREGSLVKEIVQQTLEHGNYVESISGNYCANKKSGN